MKSENTDIASGESLTDGQVRKNGHIVEMTAHGNRWKIGNELYMSTKKLPQLIEHFSYCENM